MSPGCSTSYPTFALPSTLRGARALISSFRQERQSHLDFVPRVSERRRDQDLTLEKIPHVFEAQRAILKDIHSHTLWAIAP